MIVIDKERCIGCGACERDCPAHALRVREKTAEWMRDCIHCGHCVAVCPKKAVSIPDYEMEDVEEYRAEAFRMEPERFLRAVKFRRSIRRFQALPVGKETAQRLLQAGRYTATAKNMQDCTFIWVEERLDEFKSLVWREMPGVIARLSEENPEAAAAFAAFLRRHTKDPANDSFFFNAPTFLTIAARDVLDGGLAAANIEMMAVAMGAGALYSGYMMRVLKAAPALQEWLGIGEKQIACCMLLGYPEVSYRRTAPRKRADIVWK